MYVCPWLFSSMNDYLLMSHGRTTPNHMNWACWWVSNNALFWKSQTHSVNDSIHVYGFAWAFLEIPVKNCIVGILWAFSISNIPALSPYINVMMMTNNVSYCRLIFQQYPIFSYLGQIWKAHGKCILSEVLLALISIIKWWTFSFGLH